MFSATMRSNMSKAVNTVNRLFSLAKPSVVYDVQQESALKETCFLVNENDNIVGHASKKDCHLVQPDGKIPLHRAFSVFLFNSKGELLLQKRSSAKITFPDCYTNTCCSHPIQDVPGEDDENQAIGIKRAAQRRLNYELGIPISQIPTDGFKYLTRIHYYNRGDGKWGEHEIDYILFMQSDVQVKPNPNEISEVNYVSREQLASFVASANAPLSPWFSLILKNNLRLWWEHLAELSRFVDHENIHKLE